MQITIEKHLSEPIYEQIGRQVEELIAKGLLTPGMRMPSIRQLAQRLGLANSTVAIAYDNLAARQLIETRRGSGTYVAAAAARILNANLDLGGATLVPDQEEMEWGPYSFGSRFFAMPIPSKPEQLIRFTQASPDPDLFPLERIKQVSASMLWAPKSYFFDRANPQGYQPLVEHLEREMALRGVSMAAGQNDIILVGGFQRALSLLVDFLIRPHEKVAIESPAFTGILNLLIAKRIGFVPIPTDEAGMDVEYLENVLSRGEVQAVITIPTFNNPTGVSMEASRRERLLNLSRQYKVPIIEDDWARSLRYEGEEDPLLKAIDPGGYVIHVGTYSKSLLPGLRIGWITCPADISVELTLAKQGADNSDSQFLQALLFNFIEGGHYHRHLRHTLKHYRRRCNLMCDLLEQHLPHGCSFVRPQGGFSVWVKIPPHLRSMPLLGVCRKRGVDFSPSAFMMPDRYDTNSFRLSFSRVAEDEISQGIPLLCRAIVDSMNQPELLQDSYRDFEDLFK